MKLLFGILTPINLVLCWYAAVIDLNPSLAVVFGVMALFSQAEFNALKKEA